jgi:Glycosyl transferase family group 2
MSLAEDVGGWDADVNAIGEDMHMLLKCFFLTNGQTTTRTVFSAASQCNITGRSNKDRTCTSLMPDFYTIYMRYKQGLRHMWGSLDSGYALRQTMRMRRILGMKHLTLMYMLWQAHFLIVHFFIALIFPLILSALQPADAVHPLLRSAIAVSGNMRLTAFILFNVAFFLHDALHEVCARARSLDNAAAGLPSTVDRRCWYYPRHLAERAVLPVVGFTYGVLPSIVAQVSHLWTQELVYVVASKPKVEGRKGNRPKLSVDCNV